MSRKFQGRKLTVKYPFRKLKKRQGWEVHGRSVKRHLFEGWRDFKITLRKEMAAGHPESQKAEALSPPAMAPPPPLPRVGRKQFPGGPRAGSLLPSLMPGRNELEGAMRRLSLLSGWEDPTSIVTVAVHLFCLVAIPWVSSILFLPTLSSGY